MVGKIINFIVICVCLSLFIGLLVVLSNLESKREQACEDKGMIYVQPRGDRGYCTTGFRP